MQKTLSLLMLTLLIGSLGFGQDVTCSFDLIDETSTWASAPPHGVRINGIPSYSPGGVTVFSQTIELGLGDGTTLINPTFPVDHIYPGPGTYNVTGIVYSEVEFDGEIWTPTCFSPPLSFTFTSPAVCTAVFTNITSDLTADFTDASTSSPGTITSWSWDFGDGNTSTITNPSHTYPGAGTYVTCLTISTDDGCTDTICQAVTVTDPPTAVPTMGQWGLIILGLSLLSAGAIAMWRQKKAEIVSKA